MKIFGLSNYLLLPFNRCFQFIFLLCITSTGWSQTTTTKEYTLLFNDVTIDNGIITSCSYKFTEDENVKHKLIIPKSVKSPTTNETIDILGVGKSVFSGKSLTSVTFPQGLVSIGEAAFSRNQLTKIDLPSSLIYIGKGAFFNNQLTNIVLPSSLIYIGQIAFYDNPLTDIVLPSSVRYILAAAFYSNIPQEQPPRIRFDVDENNKSQIVTIGVNAFFGTVNKSTITLPDNGNENFVGYKVIRSIGDAEKSNEFSWEPVYAEIPYTLTEEDIEVNADGLISKCFCDKFSSRTVIIPKSISTTNGEVIIKALGEDVFKDKGLATIAFEDNSEVTTIGDSAFFSSPDSPFRLYSITLPSQLKIIGDQAFKSNILRTLSLPANLKTIGENAFSINSLSSVEFSTPSNLHNIGKEAFSTNDKLTSFTLPSVRKNNFRTFWKKRKKINELEESTVISHPTIIFSNDFNSSFSLDSISQVTLTTLVEGQGTITPSLSPNTEVGADMYDINTEVTLTAKPPPDNRWRFEKWVIDGVTKNTSETKVTLNKSKEATAYFVQLITLTIAIDGDGKGGTIVPANKTYTKDIGSTIELTAHPSDGWQFEKWVIAEEDETSNPITPSFDKDKIVTAHFIEQVTLTTAHHGDGSITSNPDPVGDRKYGKGSEVILTATAAVGWRFEKWVIDGVTKNTSETKVTLNKSKEATAYFVQLITLTIAIDGDGTVKGLVSGSNSIDKGVDFQLEAIPTSGHKFVSWTIGTVESKENPYTLSSPNDDVSVKATFDPIPKSEQATLTVDKVGDGAVIPGLGQNFVEKDKEISLTATAAVGWRFEKWVIDGVTKNTSETKVTLNKSKEATAYFVQLITLTIAIDGDGTVKGLVSGSNSIDKGVDFQLEAIPTSGHKFVSWTIGTVESKENPYTLSSPNDDVSVKATFDPIPKSEQATLTVDKVGDGAVIPGLGQNFVEKDKEISLTATAAVGWRFEKWVIDGVTKNTSETKVTLNKSKEATAYFVQLITLTIAIDGDGTVKGLVSGSNSIDKGVDFQLEAIPTSGHKFVSWTIGTVESKENPYTLSSPNDDVSVKATFDPIPKSEQATLTVDKVGDGAVIPGLGQNFVEKDKEISLTATAAVGWRFEKWVIDGVTKNTSETKVTLNKSKEATAYFVQLITLTIAIDGDGTVKGLVSGSNSIDKGVDFQLEAIPASGHKFVSWTIGTVESKENPYTLSSPNDDVSVKATFDPIPKSEQATLTVDKVGDGAVIPGLGQNFVEKDKEISLTATAAVGWRFEKWVIDGVTKNTSETKVTLNKSKEATAYFVQLITLTIAIDGDGTVKGLVSGSNSIDKGVDFQLEAIPTSGHKFVSWTIGTVESKENPYTLSSPNDDVSVKATFDPIPKSEQATLTVDKVGDGVVIPGLGQNFVEKDKEISLTATAAVGWRFEKWVIDGVTKNTSETKVTLNKSKEATAYFVQLITLTIAIDGDGTVKGLVSGSNSIDKGVDFQLEAIPTSGHKFVSWTIGTVESKENPYTLSSPNDDVSVKATFAQDETGGTSVTSILDESFLPLSSSPNPAFSHLTITARDGDRIQLFSPAGISIYETLHRGTTPHQIDCGDLSAGVYLLRLTDSQGNTFTKRVVKE